MCLHTFSLFVFLTEHQTPWVCLLNAIIANMALIIPRPRSRITGTTCTRRAIRSANIVPNVSIQSMTLNGINGTTIANLHAGTALGDFKQKLDGTNIQRKLKRTSKENLSVHGPYVRRKQKSLSSKIVVHFQDFISSATKNCSKSSSTANTSLCWRNI
jgi:hypothetical protein